MPLRDALAPTRILRIIVRATWLLLFALVWASPSKALPTPERSRETQIFLQRELTRAVTTNRWPGAAAAVVTHGQIYTAAAGRRRIDRPERVTVNDRFGLGSNTKAFTASVLGRLVEQGKLRWDSTLGELLPDLAMRPEFRAVTVRQLLAHRAGLRPWTSPEAFEQAQTFYTGDLTTTRVAFARAALSEEPITKPGTASRYSNVDYVVAALIAERVSGENWQMLVTELIMDPLKMKARFAGTTTELKQPWGHSRSSGRPVPIDPRRAQVPVMQGAGGIALSIVDYSRFIQANLQGLEGQDTPILKASTIRELHKPVDGPYALGWHSQDFAGAPSSAHAGGNGEFYALVVIQPERDLAVVLLTNDGGDEVENQASAFLKVLIAGMTPRR